MGDGGVNMGDCGVENEIVVSKREISMSIRKIMASIIEIVLSIREIVVSIKMYHVNVYTTVIKKHDSTVIKNTLVQHTTTATRILRRIRLTMYYQHCPCSAFNMFNLFLKIHITGQ